MSRGDLAIARAAALQSALEAFRQERLVSADQLLVSAAHPLHPA